MEHHALDSQSPSLAEVIDKLIESTWKKTPPTGYLNAIQDEVDNTVLFDLMSLAADENTATQVRAIATLKTDQPINLNLGWPFN